MDKVILFDVDYTLMDIPDLGKRCFPPLFRDVYGKDRNYFWDQTIGFADQGIIIHFMEKAGLKRKDILLKMDRSMEYLVRHFKKEIEKDLRDCVLPGVRELLQKLRDEGFHLGLLTGNLEPIAWEKMKRTGLEGFFRFGSFGSDAIERNDLLPKAKERAEKMLGKKISAGRIVVIGDTPRDVECAKVNGAKAIGVATGPFSTEELKDAGANHAFPDLTEGDKIIETIKSL